MVHSICDSYPKFGAAAPRQTGVITRRKKWGRLTPPPSKSRVKQFVLITDGRSFTNIAKNNGEHKLPSGVPESTCSHIEQWPFTMTRCLRLDRNDSHHLSATPWMPYEQWYHSLFAELPRPRSKYPKIGSIYPKIAGSSKNNNIPRLNLQYSLMCRGVASQNGW